MFNHISILFAGDVNFPNEQRSQLLSFFVIWFHNNVVIYLFVNALLILFLWLGFNLGLLL